MPPAPTSPRTVDSRRLMSHRRTETAKNVGITCGTTPYRTTFRRDAPVASSASIGLRSISSMASPTSFPRNPRERKMIANMPASTPGPKMATNSSAQMIVFTDRLETRMNRPSQSVARLGVVFCAAIRATGRDRKTAKKVAMVAMFKVSTSAQAIPRHWVRSGGTIRPNRSPICCGASSSQGQKTSMVDSDQTVAAVTSAMTPNRIHRWRDV